MGFNLLNFLKLIPLADFLDHINEVAGEHAALLTCHAPQDAFVAAAEEWMQALPEPVRKRLWLDFENADLLAKDAHGRKAMRSVIADNDLRLDFDSLADTRACALFLARTDSVLFDKALAAHYADRQYNGKSWSAYEIQDDGPFTRTGGKEAAFREDLMAILDKRLAPGRLQIDWFERQVQIVGANHVRTVLQAAIYRESTPKSDLHFDDDAKIAQHIARPVQEAALVFCPETGQLDLVCPGGRPVHEQICETFVRTMTDGKATFTLLDLPSVCFSPLECFEPFLEVRPDDESGFTVTLGARQRRDQCHPSLLHERSRATFADHTVLGRQGWKIDHARLRVRFKAEPNRRAKSVSFDLYAPNRSNLRTQTERHQQEIRRLLVRWGFFKVDR